MILFGVFSSGFSGRKKTHRRIRIGDAHALVRHFCRERRGQQFVPREIALVFHHERAAVFRVIEQAPVHSRQIGAQFVSANAHQNRVVAAQIAERDRHFVEHVHLDADLPQRFGKRVVVARDISDVQAGRHVQVEHVRGRVGGLAPIARGQRGNRLERSAKRFISEPRVRMQRIRARRHVRAEA